MAVTFEARGDSQYNFDVTLYHDDDGEEGYANWWQVETLAGDRLGRRELLHAHGTREFTRSETIDVGQARCVVVRGHDQIHEYGGQVIVVNLDTGEMETVRQGADALAFAEYEGVC
jgi:mRNA-degrading endonuclease toxin of MazEF toxin-antitoxin module